MKLDELLLVLTALVTCALSLFERGLMLQTAAFCTVIVASFRFDPKKKMQQQTTGAIVPPFFPGAGARILVPLLLVAERVYHMRYSVGHNPAPLWAALIWVWCSVTYEAPIENKQQHHQQRPSLLPIDSERLSITLVYAITTSLAFLVLTLNLHVGGAFFSFIIAALLTESLLRSLFHDFRCSTIRSVGGAGAAGGSKKAADAEEAIRVLDSEIFLIATLAGWLACDVASNPFVVSPKAFQAADSGASSAIRAEAMRKNTASALPEHVVGRSLLFGAWLAMILYAVLSRRNEMMKGQQQKAKQPSSVVMTMPLSKWLLIVSFTGIVSLVLTGWQCAYCYNESSAVAIRVAQEEQQHLLQSQLEEDSMNVGAINSTSSPFFITSLPLRKRLQRIALKFKMTLLHSADFQNPLRVWKSLLLVELGHSASNTAAETSSAIIRWRLAWIAIFFTSIPLLSAVPFLLSKIHPALHRSVPRIVWRKWFHLVAVAAFTLPTFVDPRFMAMAWMGALGLAALVELARFCAVPPFASLTPLLEAVTDDRDALVIRTHWYLMLGCALPVIVTQRTAFFWSDSNLHWIAVAAMRIAPGLGCLGVGDALSAIFGTVLGRAATSKWAVLFNPVGFYDSSSSNNSTAISSESVSSPPASPLVRKNPVLEKKSLAGTLIGGFLVTFLVVVLLLVLSRFATDKFVIGIPFAMSSFVVSKSFVETVKVFVKLAAVIGYGAMFETFAGGVDNLELPLAAMSLSFVLW